MSRSAASFPQNRKPWGFAKFFTVWFFGIIAAIFASIWVAFIVSDAFYEGNLVPLVAVLLLVGLVVYDVIFRSSPADEDID